jgi:hypothetical protein
MSSTTSRLRVYAWHSCNSCWPAGAPDPTSIFVSKPRALLLKVKNYQSYRPKHYLSILETALRTLARLKDPVRQAGLVTVVERTERRTSSHCRSGMNGHGSKELRYRQCTGPTFGPRQTNSPCKPHVAKHWCWGRFWRGGVFEGGSDTYSMGRYVDSATASGGRADATDDTFWVEVSDDVWT